MSARRVLAQITAVAATSFVVVAGMNTVASAAPTGSVSVVSGGAVLNDTTHTLVVSTSEAMVASPAPAPQVTLTRTGTSDALATVSGTVSSTDGTVSAPVNYALANPGTYSVEVTQLTRDDFCSACVTVVGLKPTITSVSVPVLGEGTPAITPTTGVSIDFNGTHFANGPYSQCAALPCPAGTPSIAIVKNGTTGGDPNITLAPTSPATAPTATKITLKIAVGGSNTSSYTDDIVVTNSDGIASDRCVACLMINPQPTISSAVLQPTGLPSIGANATGQTVVITGDHFPADATAVFTKPAGAGTSEAITYGQPTILGTTQDGQHQTLTLNNVSSTAVTTIPSTWTITVTSPTQHGVSNAPNFTVNAAPSPTGVSYPDAANGVTQYGQGAQGVRFTVNADHTKPFVAGSDTNNDLHTKVVFTDLPAGVQVTNQIATVPGGSADDAVQVTLAVPDNTTLGAYHLMLVNPDGGTSPVCSNASGPPAGPMHVADSCFLTIGQGPKVTSVSPATVTGGFTGSVTVTGTGFHTGSPMHVRVGPADAPFYSANVTPTDSTHLTTGALNVPGDQNTGNFDVVVVNNDDRGQGTGPGIFHIATVTIGTPSPSAVANDTTYQISAPGGQISPNATFAFAKAGLPTITGTNLNVNGAHSTITGTFALTDVAPGPYDVVVTNPPDDPNPGTAVCPQCFTVVASGSPTVDQNGVNPTALGAGATNELVSITGTHIFPGAVMSFSNSHVHLVGSPTVTPTGAISQHVSVDAGTAADATGTVSVTNTDGQAASHPFTVNAGPTVTSIDPAKRAAGSGPFTFTVHGSGFSQPTAPTLTFSASSITASNYTVNAGGDTLTAKVTIPAGVVTSGSPIAVHVTVVNPDHGRGTSPTDLAADPRPTIAHFAPNPLAAGQSTTLEIVGTNFAAGVSVALHAGSSGLTFGTPTVTSPTEIDVPVTVAANAAKGSRTIDVTNADAGKASKTISVITKPTAPAPVNAAPADHSLRVSWRAPSDNGGSTVSGYSITLTKHSNQAPAGNFDAKAGVTSHTFGGLTNGIVYDVRVIATNAAGNSPAATGSGTPANVPGKPTNVRATPSDGRVLVKWVAPASTGAGPLTGFVVRVSPSGRAVLVGASSKQVVITHLTNGTTYAFTVAARNKAGTGAPSAAAHATPKFGTTVSIKRSAASVKSGTHATLSGRLIRSDNRGRIGATIVIYRKIGSGAYKRMTAVTSDSTGRWHLSITPGQTATYYARFFGDAADRASTSSVVRIAVT